METRKIHLLKKESQGGSRLSPKAGGAKEGVGQKVGASESKDHPLLAAPFLPSRILYLQRTIGNQGVARWLKSGGLQARLMVSEPGDSLEREADRLSSEVLSMPGEPALQRKPT